MEQVYDFIISNKLIKPDEIIGVAVSGGRDSMALLHYLNSIKDKLDCQVLAVNIDHCIRENSANDSLFVHDYCEENNIRFYKFKVDALKLAHEQNLSTEQAARQARYGVFESLIQKGVVNKIALAHHTSDQAETILLNIFRGTGLAGAKGMEANRENKFVRPFLDTSREEIEKYIAHNQIPYVDDETNSQNDFTRNYLRNVVMPLLNKKFPSIEKNVINFGKICEQDENYINSQIHMGAITSLNQTSRIPLTYFNFAPSIINRIVLKVLNKYSKNVGNIESKHVAQVCEFAKNSQNGALICLPNGIKVYKEYDFITVTLTANAKLTAVHKFKKGTTYLEGYGSIIVKGSQKLGESDSKTHYIDADTVPENAIWRFRTEGDTFAPFANGTKKLKSYLIDKKIPQRLRDTIPVLAVENTILVVANVEISDKLKVTEDTKKIYKINYEQDLV
ncbi:MAG: tRNA lysidine(34) synthetase TilS [Clostridia bacterium]|nr:tRNA lysidine(34) synthetase TilS [Clostridia bacterium]